MGHAEAFVDTKSRPVVVTIRTRLNEVNEDIQHRPQQNNEGPKKNAGLHASMSVSTIMATHGQP
jgi:hypothetical protein